VVYSAARQISAHAERRLAALVVAGKMTERAIAQTLIKELSAFVPRAHFEGDPEYAPDDSAFLQPLEKLASDAGSSIRRSHREKVQVCIVISVTHDCKPGNFFADTSDEHVNIVGVNTRRYPRWRPTPLKAVLN
jgi:hypothetical protein